MNYLNSSHTGRAARTLESAFGVESARVVIHPMPTDRSALTEAGHTVAVVLGVVLIVSLPFYCYFN